MCGPLVHDLEVEEASIARERGPARLLPLPWEEFDSAPAVLVVHPDSAPGRLFAVGELVSLDDDVLAVGTPRRRHGAHVVLAEDRAWIGAVGVHHPEVVLSPPVADEGDECPIGGDARVGVDGDAAVLG